MSHLVKQVLLSNAYWVLNKEVVKKLGLESAFILGVFADGESTLADENGWFYQTSATITELTGLTNHKQSQAISKLVEIGVLSQENRGVPCKRFFKINYENLEKLVFKNFENYSSKNLNTSIQKISNNKESIIKKVSKESKDKDIRVSILNLKKLLESQFDVTMTPTQVDKLVMLSVQYEVNPLEIYNNSDYLRGFVDKKPTWRMWTANAETTIQNMKAGQYVNKDSKKADPVDEKKEFFKKYKSNITILEVAYRNNKLEGQKLEWAEQLLREEGRI